MTAAEHDVRAATPPPVEPEDATTHTADTPRTIVAQDIAASLAHELRNPVFPIAPPAAPPRPIVAQDIAASLAHELRNPVFAIASAARLLRYRVVDDPVMEKNIGRILREAERLNGFVNALLEYGRPAPVRLTPAHPHDLWNHGLQAEPGPLRRQAATVRA